jgi:hypothetical protein
MHTQDHHTTQLSDVMIPPTETPTLYRLAVVALAENDNNTDAAEEYLIELFQSDPDLLRALVRGAVKSAVTTNVGGVIRDQRKAIIARQEYSKERADAAGARIAHNFVRVVKSLLDFPLSKGTLLKDATNVEVLASADRYEKQSSTMAHRARWLRALAERVPNGQRVGDVLTESNVKEIYDSAA